MNLQNQVTDWYTVETILKGEEGLHARPAGALYKIAIAYEGQIQISTRKGVANAKSIFELMSLGISEGTKISLKIENREGKEEIARGIVHILTNPDRYS